MSTAILQLPQFSFATSTVNTADLLDTIATFTTSDSLPIDITGIFFEAQVRSEAKDIKVWVDASSENGLLVNGGPDGTLSWRIPLSVMTKVTPGNYVTDIRANADGHLIAIAQRCTFTVTQGVTR